MNPNTINNPLQNGSPVALQNVANFMIHQMRYEQASVEEVSPGQSTFNQPSSQKTSIPMSIQEFHRQASTQKSNLSSFSKVRAISKML